MSEVAVVVERGAAIAGFDRDDITALADNFSTVVRSFVRLRAKWLAAAEHDVEWSGHVVLKVVDSHGPLRAGAIAEALQFDPSTVSRQVATLVRDGLLERRADPEDGRASLLVLTPRAEAVLADHDEVRLQHFADLVEGWPADDVARLAELLGRFGEAYDAKIPYLFDERIRTRSTD